MAWLDPVASVYSILLVFSLFPPSSTKTHGDSACFGSADKNCHFIELSCPDQSRIELVSQVYGYKDHACKSTGKNCQSQNDGCCSYSAEDCLGNYTASHVLDLYTFCSFASTCGRRQVPRARLSSCDDKLSKYAYVRWTCVEDINVVQFCEDNSIKNESAEVMFNSMNVPDDKSHSDCTCTINNSPLADENIVTIYLQDVRLITQRSDSSLQSNCSSAALMSADLNISKRCDPSGAEVDNFYYSREVATVKLSTSYPSFSIDLKDVFKNGEQDMPVMVRMKIVAAHAFLMRCKKTTPGLTTTLSSLTTESDVLNGSKTIDETTSNSNIGVIVGITVPLLLVFIVAGAVLFFLWRKKRLCNDKKEDTDNPSQARNSTLDSSYAEIADIPNILGNGERHIDNEYRTCATLSNERPFDSSSLTQNSPRQLNTGMYVNGAVGNTIEIPTSSKQKMGRSVYDALKDKRNRVLTFFNMRGPEDDGSAPLRSTENVSGAAHRRISKSDISIVVVTPENSKIDVQVDGPAISVGNKSPGGGRKKPPSPKGMKAVKIADQYIEFKFGELDEDNDIQSDPSSTTSRPAKPNRPAPVLTAAKTNPGNQGQLLLPNSTEDDEHAVYDYADVDEEEDENTETVRGNPIENTTNSEYDYADADADGDMIPDECSAGQARMVESFYEEVDGKRVRSVKQRHSAPGSEYYEVPISQRDTKPSKSETRPGSYVDTLPMAPPAPTGSQQGHIQHGVKETEPRGTGGGRKTKSPVVYELQKALFSNNKPDGKTNQNSGDSHSINIRKLQKKERNESPLENGRGTNSSARIENRQRDDVSERTGVKNIAKKFELSKQDSDC